MSTTRKSTTRGKRPATDLAPVARKFLRWYQSAARDLPWRRTRDPYAVWVSEIMLQQTQVNTVIPYWERWMKTLPDIQSLATVSSDRLHKLWEGLGYYTRVRNMQKAAKIIVEHHDGSFPEEFETILALPGIGRYTAGAISSIAFNQSSPILDGNVIRVLTRLFAIEGNPKDKEINERLWSISEQLVKSTDHPMDLNQSLMELGALVCTPKQPKCPECPFRKDCEALAREAVDQFPNASPRPTVSQRQFAALILEHRGRILVRQRPEGVVNAHLWEFPNVEIDGSKPAEAARTLAPSSAGELTPLPKVKHSITRYRITVHPFRVRLGNGTRPKAEKGKWMLARELSKIAFTSAHGRILKSLYETEPRA